MHPYLVRVHYEGLPAANKRQATNWDSCIVGMGEVQKYAFAQQWSRATIRHRACLQEPLSIPNISEPGKTIAVNG